MKKINKIDAIFYLIVFTIAILFISVIFNDSVWGDEAFTMLTVQKSFGDILKITARRCTSSALLFYC